MLVRPIRLVVCTLVLALPLAAAAGCGATKKRTIKQELVSAQSHLAASKAASFTLRVADGKGSLADLAADSGDLPAAAVKDLIGASVRYTFDAASAAKIKGVDGSASEAELRSALADVRFAIAVKDAKTTVAEIRLVDSALFARVDLDEIDRVAKEAGSDGVADSVDEFIDSAPDEYQPALRDAKAGKWLKLPLTDYLDKIKDLTDSLPTPAPSTAGDVQQTGEDLLTAIKPFVKVTDANDSSSQRVLDVNVDARGALKAALGVLKTAKGLPFVDVFQGITPAEVDKSIRPGSAHGTISLADGHLTQVTVDLASIEALDPDFRTHKLSGSSVVVDVDDSAGAVTAPTDNVSDVDVKGLLDDLLQGFGESFGTALSGDVTS